MKRFNCAVAILLTYVLCASALLQPVSAYAASAAGEGAGSVATEQSNSSEEADESEGPIESSDDESSIPLENVDKEQPVDISSSDDQPNDNPEQEGVDGSDPQQALYQQQVHSRAIPPQSFQRYLADGTHTLS